MMIKKKKKTRSKHIKIKFDIFFLNVVLKKKKVPIVKYI